MLCDAVDVCLEDFTVLPQWQACFRLTGFCMLSMSASSIKHGCTLSGLPLYLNLFP